MTNAHAATDASHHEDTVRLEAFSDGVFSIAITLLIIEIGVPHVDASQDLAVALRHLWPSYVAYVFSFFTIGVMWMNHHGIFKDIDRADHWLMVLNLFLLICIVFIPFPTAVLAEYMKSDEQALEATLFYGGTLTVTALAFNAMWLYAARGRRLIDPHVAERRVQSRTRRYLPGTPLYAIGIPLAFVSTWAAIALWFALAIFFLLPPPVEPDT